MSAPVLRAAAASRRLPIPTIPEVNSGPTLHKNVTSQRQKLTNPAAKAQRTSKTSQKLVLLPSEPQKKPLLPPEDDLDVEVEYEREAREGVDKHSPGERMNKEQRKRAGYKRLTAYCIADGIKTKATTAFLKREHGVSPRVFDEAIYVMYHLPLLPGYIPTVNVRSSAAARSPSSESFVVDLTEAEENGYVGTYFSASAPEEEISAFDYNGGYILSSPETVRRSVSPSPAGALLTIQEESRSVPSPATSATLKLSTLPPPIQSPSSLYYSIPSPSNISPPPANPYQSTPPMKPRKRTHPIYNIAEVIIFSYGVVVFFNLPEPHERAILEDLDNAGLLSRKLKEGEWEVEECHFEHDSTAERPRIYNDFFTLKSPSHLLKISISHALAQSTLLARYESLTRLTLSSPSTLSIPTQLAQTGSISLRRREAMRLSGRLFKLKRDVNLVSNVLDVPELFWSEASLGELYVGVREYLEIGERVEELNRKLEVVRDLLDLIHEHLNGNAMVRITWIIIWLIVVAILVELGEALARVVVNASRSGRTPSSSALFNSSIEVMSSEAAMMALQKVIAGGQARSG